MTLSLRFTSADLELLPDDGKRYEIIDGELFVSKQPHWHHQETCFLICAALHSWSVASGLGKPNVAPGVIFADDDDVAPDVVWASTGRIREGLRDGHLYAAPELVVEVLSPGSANERRDREAKRRLYSRRGVLEYWIVDWRLRTVEVYRRAGPSLELVETLTTEADLRSPVLPGFSASIASFFPSLAG